jgi:tRNA threonylcarbamoyladenosine biosynthesis protein TsaB
MYLGINLAIEPHSIALVSSNQTLSEITEANSHDFSENLIHRIEELILKANTNYEDINGIGITTGPGNYTSLRIGTTLAKTLGQTLQKPIYPISSLKAIAHENTLANGIYFSILSARKTDYNCAMFSYNNKKLSQLTPDFIWEEPTITNKLLKIKEPVYLCGAGFEALIPKLNKNKNILISTKKISGTSIAQIAIDMAQNKENHPLHTINPKYSHQPNIYPNHK